MYSPGEKRKIYFIEYINEDRKKRLNVLPEFLTFFGALMPISIGPF